MVPKLLAGAIGEAWARRCFDYLCKTKLPQAAHREGKLCPLSTDLVTDLERGLRKKEGTKLGVGHQVLRQSHQRPATMLAR
jgi:hypothetical protein